MDTVVGGTTAEQGEDVRAAVTRHVGDVAAPGPHPLVDPHWGDVGDDIASPERRSLLAIGGSLVIEISLPKLLFALAELVLLPALILGLAPLLVSAWVANVSKQLLQLSEIGAALIGMVLIAVGVLAWRPLFRIAEANFWSLNALAVQPGYAFCREALRHLAEGRLTEASTIATRARVRAASSAAAGILLCGFAVLIAVLVWPASRWTGTLADLIFPHRFVIPTLANAVVLVSVYTAIAALIWGIADARMDQPHELTGFDAAPSAGRTWRIAHLSDIHVVGERYGFRIESGRGGPRGNVRLEQAMRSLAAIHRVQPLDAVLVSGDVTDAGLATEWAEFLDVVAQHPALATRMILVPGNHDLNIVDSANPARLDLPLSIGRGLRQMRTLSAIAAVQGNRVHLVDRDSLQLAGTLNEALAPHRSAIVAFMDNGGLLRAARLRGLFEAHFPMILPPETPDGLGIAILNSNATTHFSFTNALGVIGFGQSRRLAAAVEAYPRAHWIIALHHHLIEYPTLISGFSERVGTSLVNGSWFIRRLARFAVRSVVMHGHRHIDWTGACGALKILSAPSPVMGSADVPTHFYIHTLAAGLNGQVQLLTPERVEVPAAQTRPAH